LKNRKRWTFGSLYPRAWAHGAGERSRATVEVLVLGDAPSVRVRAVFLAWCERRAESDEPRLEALERRVDFAVAELSELRVAQRMPFTIPAESWRDGDAVFSSPALEGTLELCAEQLAKRATSLTLRLENTSPELEPSSAEEAALRSFASAHLVLEAQAG